MSLAILHHLLNVSVQLANKSGFKQKKKISDTNRVENDAFTELLLSNENGIHGQIHM
jgi:hypothetical protein